MQFVLSPVSVSGPIEGAEERGAFYALSEPPVSVYIGRLHSCLLDVAQDVELKPVEVNEEGVPVEPGK